MVGIPQDVIDHRRKEGMRKRSEWGIADLREKASPEPHHKHPLFGKIHADNIKKFNDDLDTLVSQFESPHENKNYYVLEWRLTPQTRLTRAQMKYVGKATIQVGQDAGKIDKVERKKRLLDCGIDIDANGCGCGCGCGE